MQRADDIGPIPEFLLVKNRQPPTPAEQARIDAAMAAVVAKVDVDQIRRAQQAEVRRQKSRARIAKLKAVQNGATKRMPLRDREALRILMD